MPFDAGDEDKRKCLKCGSEEIDEHYGMKHTFFPGAEGHGTGFVCVSCGFLLEWIEDDK